MDIRPFIFVQKNSKLSTISFDVWHSTTWKRHNQYSIIACNSLTVTEMCSFLHWQYKMLDIFLLAKNGIQRNITTKYIAERRKQKIYLHSINFWRIARKCAALQYLSFSFPHWISDSGISHSQSCTCTSIRKLSNAKSRIAANYFTLYPQACVWVCVAAGVADGVAVTFYRWMVYFEVMAFFSCYILTQSISHWYA